jgi:poly(3-hydroxybutyrate) depolymerase
MDTRTLGSLPNEAAMSSRRMVPACTGLAVLLIGLCHAARGEWEEVTLHLKDGRALEAQFVGQNDQGVTLCVNKSMFQVRRDEIARIEGRDGTERPLRPAGAPSNSTAHPSTASAAGPPRQIGRWSDAEDRLVEGLLDAYFKAANDADRQAAFAKIEKTRLGRSAAELERMQQLATEAPRMQKHVPVPWRKGTDRGWYNLALPADYTPAKAWPLVLALHGMPSDGDNLVSWYSSYFPGRGWIVLLPTTVHRSSFWPAPDEKQELLRLVAHVCTLYRVDYRRIFCTGASGGGIGTWHWLVTLPDLFAGGISFSAAGMILDNRLRNLKNVPFYVHHGTKDFIPIGSAERAVTAARGYGATIEFHVSEGTGHTPPAADWQRAFDWLVKLPPNRLSPRRLLESPEGSLPVGYPKYHPFAPIAEAGAVERVSADNRRLVGDWHAPSGPPPADLIDGMAWVARVVDNQCDAKAVRAEIQRIAQAARAKAPAGASPTDRLYALNEVFFQSEGFARDAADPAGEKPGCLAVHSVLKSHSGGVFTLTGIYCAVARELGLPVWPVVSPYHAFGRYDDGAERVNAEMTQAGGHFDDAVYEEGYALRIPAAGTLKSQGTGPLLAAMLGSIASAANGAVEPDLAAALSRRAMELDPTCLPATLISARIDQAAGRPREATAALQRLARTWRGYAEPPGMLGDLRRAAGDTPGAIEFYQAAIRARIKPLGLAAGFDAEVWCRIAEIHADRYEQARRAGDPAWASHLNRCSAALMACLRLNPGHPRAREVLVRIGGRTVGP